MAFNIMDLFGPGAVNRLLQPAQSAQGVPNMLMTPQAAPPLPPPVNVPQQQVAEAPRVDPWAGLREQDVMRTDPMTTAAVQSAPQQRQPFLNEDRMATLNDMFTGWAMGGSPSESIAYGAKLVAANRGTRKNVNETVKWLQGKGMDEQQAKMLASSPPALNEYLKTLAEGNDPMRALQIQKAQLEIQNLQNPQKSMINAGDGQLYNPNTGEWIKSPTGGNKPPQVVELFDDATGQPYKATWNAEKGEYERVGGVKARSGMQLTTNPDGTVTLTEGAIGGLPKLTEAEGRNSGFYGRGVESHKVLSGLEGEGTSVWNNTAGKVPLIGNYLKGDGAQKYGQAKRDFINAVLRRESGAVISPEEFANAEQQYFPQPGDGPEVIKQKRKNRETTIQGLKISAGQGAAFAVPSEQSGQADPLGIR
jgi:hypothetical protein